MKQLLHAIFYAIFWSWNVTFLLVVYAGILPIVGFVAIADTFAGEIPLDFPLSLAGMIAVASACTGLGLLNFRQQPLQLIRLFYGTEAPLFLLCLMRLFLFRELTPASTYLIGTLIICIVAFALELLGGYAKKNPFLAGLQLICHSLMVLVGLSAGILLLVSLIPTAASLLSQFFSFSWLTTLDEMVTSGVLWGFFWWALLLCVLFCFGSTLFLALPLALASFYLHSWYRISKAFAFQYGRIVAYSGSIAAIFVWIFIFLSLQQQPQIQVFKQLEKPPQNDRQKQELLAQSEALRQGLLNAYLWPYRYFSTREENDRIRQLYQNSLNLPPQTSQLIQNAYNQMMSPFLYNGQRSDIEKAAKLYAHFFDSPIQKAEKIAIQRAFQSTYNRSEALAGLMTLNDRKVWLAKQKITVKERGDWADVELYEMYENQTPDRQEIFYYFSLPESAAIAGFWLGHSDNFAKRLPFTISPRGAVQLISNQEDEEHINPASLEQVGPRNYRLRIFPIPPQSSEEPEKLHLWLTYKVMQREGQWPLPQLREKRNVFWSKKTDRTLNGRKLAIEDIWLPEFVPAKASKPRLHQVNLPGGYRISAKPLTIRDYAFPKAKRFAVVLDSSRSMAAHSQQINEAFQWLKEKGFSDSSFANNDADLYVTAAAGAQPKRINDLRFFDPAKITFYGTLQFKEMLLQFVELREDTFYDGILLLTDEGSYEFSDDSKVFPVMSAPLWMVHLGGQPRAYDEATLKAIQQSRGGVCDRLPEAFQRMTTKAKIGASAVNIVDGYAWLMEQPDLDVFEAESGKQKSSEKGFEAVAARQLLLGLSNRLKPTQLWELESIQALAQQFKIVTPYSAMLVLLDDRQRQELERAQASGDRFEREVESEQEALSKPLNVSIVPEPNSGLAVGSFAIALLLLRWRQRAS